MSRRATYVLQILAKPHISNETPAQTQPTLQNLQLTPFGQSSCLISFGKEPTTYEVEDIQTFWRGEKKKCKKESGRRRSKKNKTLPPVSLVFSGFVGASTCSAMVQWAFKELLKMAICGRKTMKDRTVKPIRESLPNLGEAWRTLPTNRKSNMLTTMQVIQKRVLWRRHHHTIATPSSTCWIF